MSDNNTNFTLERAENALLSRDFALAARLYKSVLKENENDKEILLKLGNCFVRANQDEKALEPFLQVLKIENTNFEALNSLGGIYRRLGKYEESVKVLESALKLGKNVSEVNYNLGHTYKLMGYYDAAAESFYSVIEENPNDVLAYNHLGTIQAARGEYRKALQTYWRGLQIDPNHPILHFNSAQSFAALEKYDDAIASYENVLRTKPGWAEAIEGYSAVLIKQEKFQKAEEILKSSIQVSPNNSKLHNLLGLLYYKKELLDDSEAEYKNVLLIDSENYESLNGLAKIYEKLGKYPESYAVLKSMEKIAQNQEELFQKDSILKRMISVLVHQNKLKEAATLLKHERDKNPENVEILNLLAQFFIRSKEKHKELGCYRLIQSLEPNYITYLRDCGEQHSKIGNYQEAEILLNQYYELNPKDTKALTILGMIAEKKQDYDKALRFYQAILNLEPENSLALGAISKIGQKTGPDSKAMEIITEILNKNTEDTNFLINESIKTYEETVKKLESETIPFTLEEELVSEISKDIEDVFDVSLDELFTYDMNENINFSENQDDVIVLDEIDEETTNNRELNSLIPDDLPIDYVPTEKETGFYNPFEGTVESNYSIDETDSSLDVDGSMYFDDEIDLTPEEAVPEEKTEVVLENKTQPQQLPPVISYPPIYYPPQNTPVQNLPPQKPSFEPIMENKTIPEEKKEEPLDLTYDFEPELEVENETPLDDDIAFDDLLSEEELEKLENLDDENDSNQEEKFEEETLNEVDPIADFENAILEESEKTPVESPIQVLPIKVKKEVEYPKELSMFKWLRDMCNWLPEDVQADFSNSLDKLKLDYIIEKLSGTSGLLGAAESIVGNQRISDNTLAEVPSAPAVEEPIQRQSILKTMEYLQSLTAFLPNQQQAAALERESARVMKRL